MLLEEACERTHKLMESDINKYLDISVTERSPFFLFKANLTNQTAVSLRFDGIGPQGRWGRAAARTLPTMVGTGCRPAVTSLRFDGIGPQDR